MPTNKMHEEQTIPDPQPASQQHPNNQPERMQTASEIPDEIANPNDPIHQTTDDAVKLLIDTVSSQAEKIRTLDQTVSQLEQELAFVYERTCSQSVLEELLDVKRAAYRADSSRASTSNDISRHKGSIRDLHLQLNDIKRDQTLQARRLQELGGRLDALGHQTRQQLQELRDRLRLHTTIPQDPHPTSHTTIYASLDETRTRLDTIDQLLSRHDQSIKYLCRCLRSPTGSATSSRQAPIGQYRSNSRAPLERDDPLQHLQDP